MKVCNRCNESKHLDRFPVYKGYVRPTCKDCYNRRRREIQGGAKREKDRREEKLSSVVKSLDDCEIKRRYKKDGQKGHFLDVTYKGFEWTARQTSFIKRTFPWVGYKQDHLLGKSCVYKFVDDSGQVLYIGKTVRLPYRLSAHFSPSTIKNESAQWKNEVARVFYMELPSRSDMHIAEMYLIAKLKPVHNKSSSDEDDTSFNIELPEFREIWVGFVYDR